MEYNVNEKFKRATTMVKTKNAAEKRAIYSTKWIAYTALLTAMVVAMGYIPGIPVLTGKIYWCDFAIFTAAYLTDPVSAMIVGGVGTSFFDLFGINGTAYNAIPSLLIHGLQGLTASLIFNILKKLFNRDENYKKEAVIAVISSILPALIVILGYFIKRITWEGKPAEVAVLKMPANVLQEIIGIAVAVAICYACRLKRRLIKAHLLPDFKREMIIAKKENNEKNRGRIYVKKKATKNIEEKKVKAAESTVRLITKELLAALEIILPLDEDSADILAEYFETEEIGLAQDQDAHIPYDEQYMKDICRAVDDFYPSGDSEVLDINDLNLRLYRLNDK